MSSMPTLRLTVLSLRYSSWSIRPFLALTAAGADFEVETVTLPEMGVAVEKSGDRLAQHLTAEREKRQGMGSVIGLFPVLQVDGTPIHESLAICEWAADTFPEAGLWPADTLTRARARALSSEMASGFSHLRNKLSCQIFARIPDFQPDVETSLEIDRVFGLWRESLEKSGGPFLFGSFGIVDAMYFPVLTRFRTYGVALPPDLEVWAGRVESHSAVNAWRALAIKAPPIPVYDAFVREMGGDPLAALPDGV